MIELDVLRMFSRIFHYTLMTTLISFLGPESMRVREKYDHLFAHATSR